MGCSFLCRGGVLGCIVVCTGVGMMWGWLIGVQCSVCKGGSRKGVMGV